jgi:hypothetical protein
MKRIAAGRAPEAADEAADSIRGTRFLRTLWAMMSYSAR